MPCGVMFLSRSRILKVLWALMTVVLLNKLVGKDTHRNKITSCLICPLPECRCHGAAPRLLFVLLGRPCEKLRGVDLALSFIVFVSHEENSDQCSSELPMALYTPCIGSSFLCFISISSCHSLSHMSHIRLNRSPGP